MQDVHIILAAPKESEIKALIHSEGLVIGVDGGAFIAVEEDINLDIALGDFDSVNDSEHSAVKNHANKIYTFPSEKDDTDTELALIYVLENIETDKIYLYNWYGGRLDHLYSLQMLVLQERFHSLIPKIHFVGDHNFVSYYLPGEYQISKKDQMDYLSFILITKVRKLTLSGVKYSLEEVDYPLPRALISNEFLTKEAQLSFEKGIIAVIQSQDHA